MDPGQQIDTVPPWGNADGAAAGAGGGLGGLGNLAKLIGIQLFQQRIASMKIRFVTKLMIYFLIFFGQLYMNTQNFVTTRPATLYDIFQVERLSTFEEFKNARDLYLERLKDKLDPDFDGDMSIIRDYNMTKEQVADAFNVMTNNQLKEAYDKHNVFYKETDFIKKMGKVIPNLHKYMNAVKGTASFAPFILMIFMMLGQHAPIGRKMAVGGLMIASYIALEMKMPAQLESENWVVQLVNKYQYHEYALQILGPSTKFYTIHQFANYLRSVLWQSYFQFSMAMSRLVDKNPDVMLNEEFSKMNAKTLKLLQIFETLVPKRTEEVRKKEYSEVLLKEIKDREEEEEKRKELENAPKLAIEGAQEEGGNGEPKKDSEENKENSNEEKTVEVGKISPSKLMETEEEKEKVAEDDKQIEEAVAPIAEIKKEENEPKDANTATAEPGASTQPATQIEDLKEENEKTEEQKEFEDYKYERKYTPIAPENPDGENSAASPAMSEEQVREQEKMLLEFEADLLKFERYLKEKEENLVKKEQDVDNKIQSGQGLPKKPIEELVKDELKECLAKWQRRGVPQFKLMGEVSRSSWGKQTAGAFRQTLVIRKDSVIGRMKRDLENENNRTKSAAERAKNFWAVLYSWMGYLVIFAIGLALAGPPIILTVVKNEIGKGEWTHLEQAPADIIDPEIIPTPEDWIPQEVDVEKKSRKFNTQVEDEEEEDFND